MTKKGMELVKTLNDEGIFLSKYESNPLTDDNLEERFTFTSATKIIHIDFDQKAGNTYYFCTRRIKASDEYWEDLSEREEEIDFLINYLVAVKENNKRIVEMMKSLELKYDLHFLSPRDEKKELE